MRWPRALAQLVLPTWVLLSGLVVLSALARIVLARGTAAPWIIPDELVYSELGKSFAASGRFTVRGEPFSVWSFGPLYPLAIAPVYAVADSVPQAYALIKVLNSLLFSTAAVPAFLLARRVLTRSAALLAAILALLVPSALYTTKIMAESLSYPAFLFSMVAVVAALERPSTVRQLLALTSIVLAFLTRAQLGALLPAFLSAIVLLALLDARGSGRLDRRSFAASLAAFRATWCAVGVAALLGLGAVFASGPATGTIIGPRELPHLEVVQVALSSLYHLAILDLYVGVIPLASFALVVGAALSRAESSRPLRVLSVASLCVLVWVLVLAGAYLSSLAANEVQRVRVYDRYVFYVAPLCLIAVIVWLQQGLPRPRRLAGAVGLIAFLLPPSMILMYAGLDGSTSPNSSLSLGPWVIVRTLAGPTGVVLGVTAMCGGLAMLFLRVRRTRGPLLFAAVILNVLVVGQLAYLLSEAGAARASRLGVGAEPGWVDEAAGPSEVVAIWSGTKRRPSGRYAIWQNDLFNRSVGRVYHLREPLPFDPPDTRLRSAGSMLLTADGRPLRAAYVLTDETVPLAGRRVAADARTRMVLYRVDGVVRLREAPRAR